MAAAPFTFQVSFESSPRTATEAKRRSVIVEVSPDALVGGSSGGQPDKAERELAEQIADQASLEIVAKDLPDEVEAGHTIAQIGQVPAELRDSKPALQKAGVRAWLV